MKKYCLIFGMGNSGKWAYHQTLKLGYTPIVYDDEFMTPNLLEGFLMSIEFCVISPSISPNHSLVLKLRNLNIKIISEIELAFLIENKNSTIVGVTGTNGKTTVVSLLGSILKDRAMIAGNIGTPWSKVVNYKNITILELSSFQLETIDKFKPSIAVFTNLAPDHLDYHGSYENYKKAKFNLLKNADDNTIVMYSNEDDELVSQFNKINLKNAYSFGLKKYGNKGIYIDKNNNICIYDLKNETKLFSAVDFSQVASHNKLNILASVLVAYLLHVPSMEILEGIKSFKYPQFRQEEVKTSLGFKIVNDSKSTNLASTLTALKAYRQNVVLLVGGRGKREDYSKLFLEEYGIKTIIAFGESGENFRDTAERCGFSKLKYIENFNDAIFFALNYATKKDVVLFSPACSSFDEFSSYVDRGEAFNRIVENFVRNHKRV